MKKRLFVWAALALVATQQVTHAQEQEQESVYYSEDFQKDSKPATLTYYDGDGLELTEDLVGTGLECGTWHLVKLNATDTNKLMASASIFTTPGKANDWMVTPQIKIYGKGAKLCWKSMALSAAKKDGLKVYVSTKSADMSDFESSPIFSVDAESSSWQSHEVSLDAYAGKTIYIAFVNESYDKYVLCVDDIVVSGPKASDTQDCATYEVMTPIMTDTGKAQMSLRIKNTKDGVLDAAKVCYRTGNAERTEEFSEEFQGLNLDKGETITLTMRQEMNVPVNTTIIYDTWLEVNGDPTLATRDSIRGTYFISNRRSLIEEGTGTWCSNCPDGAVALEYLEENYTDNVITIAVHGDNTTDPMYYPEYIQFCSFPAYPTIMVDRKYLGQPVGLDDNYNYLFYAPNYGVEYFLQLAQRQYAVAELEGTATLTDMKNNTLEINIESRFINDMMSDGYDIALILLEDSVTAPDGSLYVQNNGRASTNYTYFGLKDTITGSGGWGSLPSTVRMKFNHVARTAYNGTFNGYGNDNQLPAELKGGERYTSKFTWNVPTGTVNNFSNASIVALMTDPIGYIVNACKLPVNISPESLENLQTNDEVNVTTTTEGIAVTFTTRGTANLYTADGTLLATRSGEGTLHFDTPSQGLYIIKVRCNGKNTTHKIVK